MTWIGFLIGLFALLLLLPIGWAVFRYYYNKDSVLMVRQNRKRNPRYFASSFEGIFLKAWENRKGTTLMMSHPEKYILSEQVEPEKECKYLVVALNQEFQAPFLTPFQREIYAFGSAHFPIHSKLRAVRARGDLILEKGTQILRWADADGTIAVYDGCDLGISLTSGTAITMGTDCTFRRLYAPVIHFGSYPGQPQEPAYQRDKRIYRLGDVESKAERLRHISHSDTDETGVARASFVTGGAMVVDEDIIVQGSVRARKGVQIADRAVVCGNVFAEEDVYLGKDSTVLGNVFTQGSVYCESGVVIGQQGRVSSVVAREKVVMEQNCFVYGYVSNEMGGICCPRHAGDEREAVRIKAQYLSWPDPPVVLTFADREDFDSLDSQGFRHNPFIREVIIPEGVRKIPDGLFFDCGSLEKVSFPASLEEIGEYAFADCISLQSLDLTGLPGLRKIGRSAFDGCHSIEEVHLPPRTELLDAAAFSNCVSLRRVTYHGKLLETGPFCFQNCPLVEPVPTAPIVEAAPLPPVEEKEGLPQAQPQPVLERPSTPERKTAGPNRKKALAGGALATAALLVFCYGALELAQSQTVVTAVSAPVREEDLYRNQGLAPGEELASVPQQISEERITFSDRVLLRCSWTEEEKAENIAALREFLAQTASRYPQMRSYVMVSPLRIGFEETFISDESALELVQTEKNRLDGLERDFLSQTGDLASSVPVMDTLTEHQSEYLFYRTASSWTALGAYYAVQEFLAAAGLETFPLDSFYETAKQDMMGTLYRPEDSVSERQYYYLYQNYNPLVEQLTKGEAEPMVSLSRGAVGMFLGNKDELMHFDGLAENGRVLMLMGAEDAAVLAPWMVSQFEEIVYVNLPYLHSDEPLFWELFSRYGVTDLLVIEEAESMGEDTFARKLRGQVQLVQQP